MGVDGSMKNIETLSHSESTSAYQGIVKVTKCHETFTDYFSGSDRAIGRACVTAYG